MPLGSSNTTCKSPTHVCVRPSSLTARIDGVPEGTVTDSEPSIGLGGSVPGQVPPPPVPVAGIAPPVPPAMQLSGGGGSGTLKVHWPVHAPEFAPASPRTRHVCGPGAAVALKFVLMTPLVTTP